MTRSGLPVFMGIVQNGHRPAHKVVMAGTITALEIQKRKKNRVNVYLDGEFAFGIPLSEALNLHTGQYLSDEDIDRLKAADAYARARDLALRYLGTRARSTAEVRDYLRRKGFAETTIEHVIERLQEWGYLDDEAFARFWVEDRERFRPRGLIALRQELRQKGISNDIIQRVLADLDPEDSARRALASRLRQWRHLDWHTFRKKAGDYLARRGFSYDIINDVVRRVWEEMQSEHVEEE